MAKSEETLFPLFLKLADRPVLLVGGGPVATAKAAVLAEAGAQITIVSPALTPELAARAAASGWTVERRGFEIADLDQIWLVVAAAPPAVNAAVAAAAEARRLFVVAVDDPPSASAYGAGIVRRAGITLALSTAGQAPALAGLLREGLDALLPQDLEAWLGEARRLRPRWRADGVPMAQRRPQLLLALNRLYEGKKHPQAAPRMDMAEEQPRRPPVPPTSAVVRPRPGRVTLVGAGPGDSDLLTIRGARRLAEADLVLFDALSSDAMRAYAPRARWFYVGKRACRQSIGQEVLNRLMIKEARRGQNVVRLKCGDSFVFGRGGEEMLALAQAGIPCEVVPGVSSAIGGPALAGIPVTHRGAASSFTVIAGHHQEVYRPLLRALPSQGMTLVVLMGLRERAAIATTLVECGWDPNTPAAVVIGAATTSAWQWTGTLAELGTDGHPFRPAARSQEQEQGQEQGQEQEQGQGQGQGHRPEKDSAPGLLVIGQVVAVAGEIERLRGAHQPDGVVQAAVVGGSQDGS